jgi:predicted phosphodiesterase
LKAKQLQGEIVTALLARFPEAPSLTLARIAFKENPSIFTSVETARSGVRRYRGAAGDRERAVTVDKSHFRSPKQPGDPFGPLPNSVPDGKSHFKDWKAFVMGGEFKALVLADVHMPYHVRSVVELAIKHGKKVGVDTVILNGDICDFFSVSFWEKDPRKRDLAGEIQTIRQFLSYLRRQFPKARIVLKLGNHEERWERYLRVKAPELLGMPEFEIEQVLWCQRFGIEVVGDRRVIRAGKLNLIHGHEYRFSISNPVNPARGFFLRAKTHCLGSHLHQSSQHSEKNLEGSVVSTWSTGCACDLNPDYSPINNWNHGFAVVEVTKGGIFQVENKRIIDGKAY